MTKTNVLKLLSCIDTKKARVIAYMLTKSKDGSFYGTIREISSETTISAPTVHSTIKMMIDKGVMVQVRSGNYKFIP